MKKITALLIFVSISVSMLALSASALFAPMEITDMKAALDSKYSDTEKTEVDGMAFAWEFDDIPTETKTYSKNVKTEISTLVRSKKYAYTTEATEETESRGVEGLSEVGVFERLSSGSAATVYVFDSEELASAFYTVLTEALTEAENSPYIHLCGTYVLEGDEALILFVAQTEVTESVKHGDFVGGSYDIIGDAYAPVNADSVGGIQFKTPDAAIRMEDGELIFGKAYKDYTAAGYKSTDAYMDAYTTNLGYDALHDSTAGKSFVLTASVRAPFVLDDVSGSMEIFRTRSSFTGVEGKVTIDSVLVRYNVSTREISIYSAGTEIKTGIYLSDFDYTALAVHVHPVTNNYDFYADGILVAKGVTFLTEAQKAKIVPSVSEEPSANTADYTLTRLRLFYTSVKTLTGELLCIDNFAWYFSEEYLECAEHSATVAGRSAEIKDKLYFNFYMNFTLAAVNDYTASVNIEVDGEVTETMIMSGVLVEGGEYDGMIKHTVGVEFADINKEITLSLSSQDGRTLYLYGPNTEGSAFLGVSDYKTTVREYFEYLLDEVNGFDPATKKLSKAILNYGAYTQIYLSNNVTEEELPNFGFAYTEEEFAEITGDIIKSAVDSKVYNGDERFGAIYYLKGVSLSFGVDEAFYISVKYNYVGMRDLTVNGEEQEPESGAQYVYKIYVKSFLQMDDIFTVAFDDGTDYYILKLSPLCLTGNMVDRLGVGQATVDYVKALYLLVCATEEYCESSV